MTTLRHDFIVLTNLSQTPPVQGASSVLKIQLILYSSARLFATFLKVFALSYRISVGALKRLNALIKASKSSELVSSICIARIFKQVNIKI